MLKKLFLWVKSRGPCASGCFSFRLKCVTLRVKTVVPIGLVGMLKTDCSVKASSALHMPSSSSAG